MEGKKRPDLVTLIAVYHFLMAALLLLGACVLLVVAGIVWTTAFAEEGAWIAGFVLLSIALLMGLILVVNVIVGLGLLALKEWARWAAIATGILDLPNFPIGTIIGAVKIWYLLTPEGKAAFQPEV